MKIRKLSEKNALRLSIGVIVVLWLQKIIRNTFNIDSTKDSFDSMPEVFLQASVVGIVTILVVSLLLYLSKEKYKDIGFSKQNILRQLRFGFSFGVLIFIIDTFAVSPIVDVLIPKTSTGGVEMRKLFASIYYLPIWIVISLLKGGFSEELWRIFTLTRFEKYYGRAGLFFALILGSIIFGIGHLYQGIGGMISISIIGLFYALVYLRKRLALEAVCAHATFDLISVALGFIVYSGS